MRLYDRFGAHVEGDTVRFAVWAPRADSVGVIGEFNDWRGQPLERGEDGVWQGTAAWAAPGALYKYRLCRGGRWFDKADPFAFATEAPPGTASRIWTPRHDWHDHAWMTTRRDRCSPGAALAMYEVHLGSFRRIPEEGNRPLTYREMARYLPGYASETGFTHVELLPVFEHPFYGSWGYQAASFFAPTTRYGTPDDLMFLIDALHQAGLGVVLDWVPSHFAQDEHGLVRFDGSRLYESAAPHPDWGSAVFDWSRPEVRAFLIASALYWLECFHFDGLRVDAVASMLYGEREGARRRENPAGIAFLREFTSAVHGEHPDALLIAEDSSAWPGVTRGANFGGLGFDLKWDLGWMNDTLRYITREPAARRYEHQKLTFRPMYAWNERYLLPLSHDEVKPPFGSLVSKMPGDHAQKLANLRLLYTYMYAQPGKKLLFMGGEFAQWGEWDHEGSLDWHSLAEAEHSRMRDLVGTLNWLYKSERALNELDTDPAGFEWIDCKDAEGGVIAFLRRGRSAGDVVLVVFNFSAEMKTNYRVGAPRAGRWREIFNSDAAHYGGGGRGNFGSVDASPVPYHGRPLSLNLTLPPLAGLLLKPRAMTFTAEAQRAQS